MSENPDFALTGYVAAAFAFHFASSESWWRRRESNPRPETFHSGIYILILNFEIRPFKSPSGGIFERLS